MTSAVGLAVLATVRLAMLAGMRFAGMHFAVKVTSMHLEFASVFVQPAAEGVRSLGEVGAPQGAAVRTARGVEG